MKRIIPFLLLLLVLSPVLSFGKSLSAVIPKPQFCEQLPGVFNVSASTSILAPDQLMKRAKQLKDYLEPALGFELARASKTTLKNVIELKLEKSLNPLNAEAYKLEVSPDKITITASSEKGIFWGIQTIRQLLPSSILRSAPVQGIKWEIPCLKIEDAPRFKWRGLMLDCSRTFIAKNEVKKYIEAMSLFKMNVLHMHLTDDQGWRIEIKKYPELTRTAARFHPSFNELKENEGFYSQDDIRELVAFAAQRNIEIVPEIEMPGHTSEVFSVLPNLSCAGDTSRVHPWLKGAGIHNEVFCAGNEETFIFLQNVLDEVAGLFPSRYIHIGGDEAPKKYWKECPKCQKRIAGEKLKDENELQSWFVQRIEKYLNSKGKKLIGWDEIMDGGLSKSATVMYWRSWSKDVAQKIPQIDNEVIMTPTSHCYFDYTYEKISSEKMYSFNPVLSDNPALVRNNVLGVQVNFWSHLDRTAPRIDRQLFPRILALSEVAWTDYDKKNWVDFKQRMESKLSCLDILGIYYFPEKY